MSSSWQIGVASTVFDADIRVAAKSARHAGFEGLQLEAFGASLDLTTLSGSGKRELRHVLSGQNLQMVSLRADLGNKGFGPSADIDAALARVESILLAAAGLLAPMICLEVGPLPAPPHELKPTSPISPQLAGVIILPPMARPAPDMMTRDEVPAQLDPTFAASVDGAMAELGQLADRHGVTIAFRSELASYAAMERALKAAGCPWFGVDLDAAAMLRDEWPADEIISRLGGSIQHVRGRDATAGADHRTKPAVIGKGSTRWDELLASLDSAGHRGWISVDSLELSDRVGAGITGGEFLRKLTRG